ncbi:MAG: two-component sensor histidine kinase [Desulfobacterales bacterium]|nr:two-component sensor histidine kinase [Desulfobacterales bacterium]
MPSKTSEEKAKPFRLVKYFTFTSLIVIFIGTLVLTALNTHWARSILLKKSEDYALVLIENLNHQVFLQFVIPVALKYGKIQLRNKEQFERMDKVVKSTLHSFAVDMVNIYDLDNTVSYSYDHEMIGKQNIGGTGYQYAIQGKSTSKLAQRGNFWEILLGFPKESKIITSAPIRAEKSLSRISGPVLGVVEIVQELSDDYKTIFKFQILVITTYTLVMSFIFLVLLFVVKRGESIIEKRALERLKLKEQLSRTKHLSSLGEMVAAVSHEIRNPLGIIRSSAELLKKKMAGVDASNPVPDIIVQESNRLNNIITDFLNFARPRNPNLSLCRIEEIIEKNLTFLAPHIESQKYLIDKRYNDKLPEIIADADMLYQAFLNLLLNAMQAMPKGGIISIEIISIENRLKIFFKDEGEGVSEDILEKIWDPFFTTKEKGTGLGLGIVKNIVESHGGSIQISNRPIQGTQVKVELPVNREK